VVRTQLSLPQKKTHTHCATGTKRPAEDEEPEEGSEDEREESDEANDEDEQKTIT